MSARSTNLLIPTRNTKFEGSADDEVYVGVDRDTVLRYPVTWGEIAHAEKTPPGPQGKAPVEFEILVPAGFGKSD